MINLALFILSTLLYYTIVPVTFVLTVVWFLLTGQFKKIDKYLFDCALSKDQHGGVYVRHLFNWWMIKKDEQPFGNPDETISSVMGKNQRANNLTAIGKALNWILNKIDPNHSIKAIEEDE